MRGRGQWRNGLRVRGIGSGRTGRESARGRLYAGCGVPCNADLEKWASRRPFGPENSREKRFGAENESQRGRRDVGPRSDVGGPRSEGLGGLKTGRNYEMRENREKWGWRGGPRSEIGDLRSEKHHPCRSVPTTACRDPWLVLGVGRIEAGRKLGENHEITKKRAGNGILWRLGGSGGPTNPIIDRKLTQIHANGESGGTEIGGLGGGI